MADESYSNIPVKPSTKERLDRAGRKSETYDQLVGRILDEAGYPK